LSVLTLDYRRWCQQQQSRDLSVAILYTSAYGNTGTLAQAIAKGINQEGVAVQLINCEFTEPEEIAEAIRDCDGFLIGSPTLAGHAPTQIQTALGLVLSVAAKTKVAGVFGSFGWSGEAVDLIENKLLDAGYVLGFETIRVKFKPTDATLQECEAAGVEFVRTLNKTRKVRAPRQAVLDAQSDRTEQATGRVTGSLSVITAKRGNVDFGFLTSWVSQAGFNPPALTISVAKDREAQYLAEAGQSFVLNVLKEGRNLQRYFLKSDGSNPLNQVETQPAANGCLILIEALAYLECKVEKRMDCGDHWLLYAIVKNGKVLESTGVTAVSHRKSGNQY
jgi:flavin reductase (DIM6/NTAB) family NADH-FMN oxidoreductase RutF/flavodoxin